MIKYQTPERPGRLVLKTKFYIRKWHNAQDHQSGAEPYAIEEFESNIGLQRGIACLADDIIGLTATTWGTGCFLGIATGSAAESATATALKGATFLYLAMDGGFPTHTATSTIINWRSTATSAQGNWPWMEYTVSTASTNTTGIKLIRKVSSQGTKVSGQVWQLTIQVTIS